MHEVEALEQQFLTESQLAAKYGQGGTAAPTPGLGRERKETA